MKRKISFYHLCWLTVLCTYCLLTACSVEEVKDNPEDTDVTLAFSVIDKNFKEGLRLRYYLFDKNGSAVPISESKIVVRDMGALSKEGTLSLVDRDIIDNYTIVALAYDKEVAMELNEKVNALTDPLIIVQSGVLQGDYFYGTAVMKTGDSKVNVDLTRPAGQMAIELIGEDDVLQMVREVEFVPATTGMFNASFLCNGTWSQALAPELSFIFNKNNGWKFHSVPTVTNVNNKGQLTIKYQMDEKEVSSITLIVDSEHGFHIAHGKCTTFKVTLQKTGSGKLKPSLNLENTAWGEGEITTDDQTEGKQESSFYNYITEYSFNTRLINSALAVVDNVVFVATGTWDNKDTSKCSLKVDYWDINKKKKLGTLPLPDELGNSYHFRVFSIYPMGNRLFIGHGEYMDMNRIEVYDISDISNPRHVTYIGGDFGYLPTPTIGHNLIGIPYAMWGKDDRLILYDSQKLSVYNINSLTTANAGKIMPLKYMLMQSGSGDRDDDDAGFAAMPDGSLYLTDPTNINPAGLRKINWNSVMSPTMGEVMDLIDTNGLILPGVKAKKILFFEENLLVLNNSLSSNTFFINYYREIKGNGIDCRMFFRPTLSQPINALLLGPQSDGKQRIIVSGKNGTISVIRIDEIFITDF